MKHTGGGACARLGVASQKKRAAFLICFHLVSVSVPGTAAGRVRDPVRDPVRAALACLYSGKFSPGIFPGACARSSAPPAVRPPNSRPGTGAGSRLNIFYLAASQNQRCAAFFSLLVVKLLFAPQVKKCWGLYDLLLYPAWFFSLSSL